MRNSSKSFRVDVSKSIYNIPIPFISILWGRGVTLLGSLMTWHIFKC